LRCWLSLPAPERRPSRRRRTGGKPREPPATTITLYIDGNLEATTTSATTVNVANNAAMRAGVSKCDGIDGTVAFTGELDELMIFRTALTQPQIQALGRAEGLRG